MKFARQKTSNEKTFLLEVFLWPSPIDFLAMVLAGPLTPTVRGHKYVTVQSDSYLKLTRALPAAETDATKVKNLFMDHRIVCFTILVHLLNDVGPHFVIKFFFMIYKRLCISRLALTAHHLSRNGRVKYCNWTFTKSFDTMLPSSRTDGTYFVHSLTYTNNTKVQRNPTTHANNLVWSRLPFRTLLLNIANNQTTDLTIGSLPQPKCALLRAHIPGLESRKEEHMQKLKYRYSTKDTTNMDYGNTSFPHKKLRICREMSIINGTRTNCRIICTNETHPAPIDNNSAS